MAKECALIYVSRITIPAERQEKEITLIAAQSRTYNLSVGITGGLVRARGWFAQLLEGPIGEVEILMQTIERDPRHCDVTVLRVVPRHTRRLSNWLMVYSGEWVYAANVISQTLEPEPHLKTRIDRLEDMIVEFASTKTRRAPASRLFDSGVIQTS